MEKVKKEKCIPKEHCSLVIMDKLKGQDNNIFKKLFTVPYSLTNKFQLLDISLIKKAKLFISNKYNIWCSKQLSASCSWNGAFENQGIFKALIHQTITCPMDCGSLYSYALRKQHEYKWIQIYWCH